METLSDFTPFFTAGLFLLSFLALLLAGFNGLLAPLKENQNWLKDEQKAIKEEQKAIKEEQKAIRDEQRVIKTDIQEVKNKLDQLIMATKQ